MDAREIMKNLDKNITLSKYFTWAEALWLPKVSAFALPNQEQISNIINMAQALDKVREFYGKPINIHSWLRTPEYNRIIGGARQSQHMIGAAVDFSITGIAPSKIQDELEKRKDIWPYIGEKGTPTWVHVDLRTGRWFYP